MNEQWRVAWHECGSETSEHLRMHSRVGKDEDGEYRCRYLLEDAARSTYGGDQGKLCSRCWDSVCEFIEGGGRQ